MAEEEVMRKRLAVEGDGGGDDRRVMSLLKTFVRWCNSKGLSDEESEATYQKMLFTLGMCDHSLVPRPFEEEEKGPGAHCLCMRQIFRKNNRKISIHKSLPLTHVKNTE